MTEFYTAPDYPKLVCGPDGSYQQDNLPVMSIHEAIWYAGCAGEDWLARESMRPRAVYLDEKYVPAYARFCADMKFTAKPNMSGKHYFNENWEYAGFVELFGDINKNLTVIDVRTDEPAVADRLVTAAMANFPELKEWRPKRGILVLKEGGAYDWIFHTDVREVETFLSILDAAVWCKQRGIRRREAVDAKARTRARPSILARVLGGSSDNGDAAKVASGKGAGSEGAVLRGPGAGEPVADEEST